MSSNKKLNKQNGGDVISASIELVKAMTALGSSIFTEINSITNIQHDLNNGVATSSNIQTNVNGPPNFKPPY